MTSPGWSAFGASTSKPDRYPCSVRIRAISRLSFDDGMSTVSFAAWMPLRMRVRKSAIGSVIGLPGALGHAGDEALVRELAQADPADAELAVHGARPATAAAAGVPAGLVLGLAQLRDTLGGLGHGSGSLWGLGLGESRSVLTRERHAEELEE